MSQLTICQATPGKLYRKKTGVKSVGELRKEAAELCSLQIDRFRLVLNGQVLDDAYEPAKLANNLIMVIPMPAPRPPPPALEPAKVTDDDFQKFRLAFGSALKNPAFTRVSRRLLKRENMESLAAACPGLETDLVAQAFLTKPQLLIHLLDHDTIKLVGEKHPALLEAAHNLAAAVHEEAARSRSSGGGQSNDPTERETESSGAYFLDDMSDDEMEADDDGGAVAGGSGRQPAPITAEQLAAALSAATGNPFMGVTGMAPQGAGGSRSSSGAGTSQSTAATTPGGTNRLTADMFQAAMQTALMGLTGGSPAGQSQPAEAAQPAPPQPDLSSQLATMKDMGIVDEGLARQALTVMGGDIQAAIELIFSGWLGE